MSDVALLTHPFCFLSVLDDLERSAVKEMALEQNECVAFYQL